MISSIEATQDFDLQKIGLGTSRFGTGGMRSKVAAAYMASEAGISTVICNGTRPGTLLSVVEGAEVGTRIHPHEEKLPGFKSWLRHAKPQRGRLQIDRGAAERLRSAGSSLLPVGIVDVDGEFSVGDAVDVYCGEDRIGKGISNYSSRELRRVIGLKTDAVREVLPDATDEVIHRDHFVLG
jgi:glutamate 5-kinase